LEIDKGVKELIRRLADEDNMVTVIADPLIEEAVTLSRGHGLKVSVVNHDHRYDDGRDSHTFSDPNTAQKIMRTLRDPN
jgi:hypothetical protein